MVKAAEAQADAAQLQGEGIARQRRAIIDGLRRSSKNFDGMISMGFLWDFYDITMRFKKGFLWDFHDDVFYGI